MEIPPPGSSDSSISLPLLITDFPSLPQTLFAPAAVSKNLPPTSSSSHPPSHKTPDPSRGRVVGKKRIYSGVRGEGGKYGPWNWIYAADAVPMEKKDSQAKPFNVVSIPLHRNSSTLRFYPSLVPKDELPLYKKRMEECQLYRQYTFGPYLEPRVHVMLSSTARQYPSLGYSYHGVKMRTLPIDLVPEFETLARDFATSFSLPNNIWSIGTTQHV